MIRAVLDRFSGRSRSTRPPPIETGPDSSHGIMPYLEDITVSFDGFRALNALTLYVEVGELRCIIGPNGAGKTTMMDVITGKTRPDSGSAWFGQTVDLLSLTEPEIAQAGVGRKFQKPTVFEHHTVFENLELAMAGDKSVWKWLYARTSPAQLEHIEQVLENVGLTQRRSDRAGALSHGQKQWLEIGMLLMQDPQLLSSLAGQHSVIVVEHDMEFVRSIARRVTVLHEGGVLAEGSIDEVQANPKVIEVYLGV
jgi:urea transport system ATP-binding protein